MMSHDNRIITFVQQYFEPDISAVAQLLAQLVSAMHARRPDYTVEIVCTNEVRPSDRRRIARPDGIRYLECPVMFVPGSSAVARIIRMLTFHAFAFWSVLLGPKDRTVICLTTPPLIGFSVALACRVRAIPFVYYIEDLYPELLLDVGLLRASYLTKKVAGLNRITLRKSARVIVLGKYMARKLWLNYGWKTSNTKTIHNWSSRSFEEREPVEPRMSLTYSGNFGFAHDFQLFFALARQAAGEGLHLRLAGSGQRAASIIQSTASLTGVSVTSSGYLAEDDHKALLESSSFLVVAQDFRTVGDVLPSKFYTYVACGRPVLFFGPRASEIGEAVEFNRIGAVIETSHDIEPAIQYMKELVDSAEQFCATCARARDYYESVGGPDRAAREIIELLEETHAS